MNREQILALPAGMDAPDIHWVEYRDEEGKPMGSRESWVFSRVWMVGDVFLRHGRSYKIIGRELDHLTKTLIVTLRY